MNRTSKSLITLVVVVAVIGGAVVGVKKLSNSGGGDSLAQVMYTVERGGLSINLTETGTVKSRDQHIVKSEVEGRTSIIFVIDEGSVVQKGDLLIELDSSSLQDRLVDQQIQVENTEADYITSEQKLEVAKIQNQSNIARAEQDNLFALEDKIKYIEGEWPKLLMKAEADVTLAEEDFRRATDEFKWSTKLFDERYLSETEYRADELSKKRTELQMALAREDLNLLKEYTHTRKLTELESEIEQKGLALERVKRESTSNLVQAEARQRATGAELTRQKLRLEKIEGQILKSKMYAPADGMVVYATSAQFSWRGDTQPLAEGQEVYERQELIHLPTADSMMVVIRIHETALGKVKVGQVANISIDALPGKKFTGTVTKIAPLPDATSVFMNPDLKVYDTQIMIDGISSDVRTGMSCKATVLIESYDDALSIPIQAVVGHEGQSIVFVSKGNQSSSRAVITGLDNSAMVHIISGLDVGEQVLLNPPLGGDGVSTSEKAEESKDTVAKAKRGLPKHSKAGMGNRP